MCILWGIQISKFQPFRHKGYLCLLNAFLCWFASFCCVWAWFPNGSFILHGNFHQSLTTFLIAETTALEKKKKNKSLKRLAHAVWILQTLQFDKLVSQNCLLGKLVYFPWSNCPESFQCQFTHNLVPTYEDKALPGASSVLQRRSEGAIPLCCCSRGPFVLTVLITNVPNIPVTGPLSVLSFLCHLQH